HGVLSGAGRCAHGVLSGAGRCAHGVLSGAGRCAHGVLSGAGHCAHGVLSGAGRCVHGVLSGIRDFIFQIPSGDRSLPQEGAGGAARPPSGPGTKQNPLNTVKQGTTAAACSQDPLKPLCLLYIAAYSCTGNKAPRAATP
uniref:Uncharacterized protein n=1 Tax=Leptobrachium leishanense TaxID=445787 RepID=A0A8C5MM18_9ANUR